MPDARTERDGQTRLISVPRTATTPTNSFPSREPVEPCTIPWVTPPADEAAFTAYVDRNGGDDFRGFLACRREDDAMAGVVNLSQVSRGSLNNAYLGFYGFAPFVRKGYMTEAVDLALRHAFRSMGLHRVEASLQPANDRSRALVERLGFRLEGFSPRYLKIAGRWRDHERWAVLAEEWRARPK